MSNLSHISWWEQDIFDMEIIIICFVLVTEGFSRFETSYIIRWLSLWAWIFYLPMAFFQSRNSTFTNEFLVLLCVILILESNAQRTVSSIFRHWITKPWKSVIPYMGDHVYSCDILAVFLGGVFCVCFLCGFCFCFFFVGTWIFRCSSSERLFLWHQYAWSDSVNFFVISSL